MHNSNLTAKLIKEDLSYPILAWSELNIKSELLLISAPDKIQVLESFQDHNLSSLLIEIAQKLKTDDFIQTSMEGDESIMAFNIPELIEQDLKWNKLIEDVEYTISVNPLEKQGLSKQLQTELESNMYRDIAAGAITTIYSSMLYVLLTKASDLGITELMFVGDMVYTERLSSLVAEHLPEHMNLFILSL